MKISAAVATAITVMAIPAEASAIPHLQARTCRLPTPVQSGLGYTLSNRTKQYAVILGPNYETTGHLRSPFNCSQVNALNHAFLRWLNRGGKLKAVGRIWKVQRTNHTPIEQRAAPTRRGQSSYVVVGYHNYYTLRSGKVGAYLESIAYD